MLHASSLISFHHCVDILETTSSSTILATICVSCFLISYIMCERGGKKKKSERSTHALEKLAGQRPLLSPIGNVSHQTLYPNEIFTWLDSAKRKWGDVMKFRVAGSSKVFVNSHDVAMQLLSPETFLSKSDKFELLQPVVGHGLTGLSPEFHSHRRKILELGFSGQFVENHLEIFCRHARKLRDSLMVNADNGVISNLMDITGLYGYKINCETAFGHHVVQDLWDMDYNEQIATWKTLVAHLAYRSSQQSWLKSGFMYQRSPKDKEIDRCFVIINNFMEVNIFKSRQRREFLKANKFHDDETTTTVKIEEVKPECFADLLLALEDKKELTKKEVLHNLNIYTAAGYDAMGTTLAAILHTLATHPEIQEKCADEISRILHNKDNNSTTDSRPSSSSSMTNPCPQPPAKKSPPSFDTFPTIFSLIFATGDLHITYAQLEQMQYLEFCIKEALRLNPVLPWLLRRTHKDIQLNDKSVISTDSDVFISTCIINRDPKHFPEPEIFKPERHSSEKTKAADSSFCMSFGAGTRICPGMMFAVQQLKVTLAHLLLAFKWESGEKIEENEKTTMGNNVNENGVDNDGNEKRLFNACASSSDNGFNVKISTRII